MNLVGRATDLVALASWGATQKTWALLLSDPVLDLASRTIPAEDDGLRALWRSAMVEYRRDLAALPLSALRPDVSRIVSALARVAVGTADDEQELLVDQLREVIALKARHGPEVFGDPATTPVAPTPRRKAWESASGVSLWRYASRRRKKGRAPVVIAYSVINRSYILDLLRGFSFVGHLLARGHDVWMFEWGAARPFDRTQSLDGFVGEAMRDGIAHVRRVTRAPRVSLFGHCIGGVFASLYAALFPRTVERLVALTTPFTAAEGGLVALSTDRRLLPIDRIVDAAGVMPGKAVRHTFVAMKPYFEAMKWKAFSDCLGKAEAMALFAAVDRWANDNPDVPGEAFRRFLHEVYLDDRLRRGQTRILRRRADLTRITCPVLNVVAENDWVVPRASAEVMRELVRSRDYRLLLLPQAFHVSLLVQPRYRPQWDEIAAFLEEPLAR